MEGGLPIWRSEFVIFALSIFDRCFFARCEGVQVGGVGSRFGVLGQWTTVSHERNDPIGERCCVCVARFQRSATDLLVIQGLFGCIESPERCLI